MKKNMQKRKIRYAVVGLGHIAQVAVLPAFKNTKNSEVTALITGDLEKALDLKKKYKNVDIVSYQDYEAYLASKKVDVVYIALPNDMHYEYTKIALQSGVHVLCEKPFTLKAAEAKELQQLADRKGVQLMVAYRLHFEESNLKAMELSKAKEIGEPRYFTSRFSFQITDPKNIRLKSERGGGPLWDIGIYCINASRYIFKDEPTEVMAMAEKSSDPRFQEVNEMVSVSMRFPKNRLANFICSFGAADAAEYSVYGTDGHITLSYAYEYVEQRELEFKTEKKNKTFKFKKSDQFGAEISYFSECILNHRKVEPNGLEGMMDTKIIEAIFESIKTKKAVRVKAPPIGISRPTRKQKIYKVPVRKVEPIKVPSPHA